LSTIEEVLANLNPKTAEAFRVASEVENEILPTPSLGLNMAMGGIGYGRFTTLYGNKGGGKTTFALQQVAQAQKEGKSTAWIDVEKNFSAEWAQRLGVNTDQVLHTRKVMSIADMTNKGRELITAGIDVLVIDSISQLLPASFFEDAKGDSKEFSEFGKTGQIGTFSKNIGTMLNTLNGVNEKTAIIIISQIRNKIGSYGASISLMGGNALEHVHSTCIKFWRTPSDIIEAEFHVGDGLLLKKPVGAPITWTIEKNRGEGGQMSNTYDLYHTGDFVGIDLTGEVVTFGVEYGVIKKKGNWLTINDEQFNGRKAAITYLRDNPVIQEKIYGEILAKSI
jgi:recombination protein RecA